ncbi:MAG: hypothetical protein J0L56_03780 [Chitinophagales bacterium]|nr:hypothetical protein [Chitinophagales bacterium]
MIKFLVFLVFFCNFGDCLYSQGKLLVTTHFYDKNGQITFTHYLRIWYKDSIVIEENTGVNTVTDEKNKTTVTYPIISYRFIDLKNKMLYDYKTFSDTAALINKAILPDSLMTDIGWSFYSEKAPIIHGIPESLSDTMIGNVNYKRARFSYTWHNLQKDFIIGYFRCDGKGNMFSLEKAYSRSLNCRMAKYYAYKIGITAPVASKEVDYISNSLTAEELRVFAAWEKNAKEIPVGKR